MEHFCFLKGKILVKKKKYYIHRDLVCSNLIYPSAQMLVWSDLGSWDRGAREPIRRGLTQFPQTPIYISLLSVMRGECNKHTHPNPHRHPPTHAVFLQKVVREYSARSYWSTAERCERWGALAVLKSSKQGKTLKFGFSYWIMSPSVGLTFQVSYTFCL